MSCGPPLASRGRGEPLGHVILIGPSGLGKTALARVLASEEETQLRTATAAVIEDPQQLTCLLARLGAGEVRLKDGARLEARRDYGCQVKFPFFA